MGFGMVLGGAAKGLESAEGALARNKQLALQEQQILGDQKLRERALGIQEGQLQRGLDNDMRAQANEVIGQELKVISEVIEAGKAAGHTPDQINAAIEPLLADVEELAPAVKRDPARIRAMVSASVNAPVAVDPKALADQFGKPPSGYRWTDDGGLEAIQGGPATKIAAGDAGRLAMLQTAKDGYDKQAKLLTKEWSAEDIASATAGVGDIGRAQRQTSMMIESAVRAASGGTVREDEIAYYEGIFMPKVTDSVATRKDKIAKLQAYAKRAEKIATQGRGSPDDARNLVNDVGAAPKTIDFNDLPG